VSDKNGYPTEEELQKIKDWDSDDIIENPMGLINYIRELWYYPDRIEITDITKTITGRKKKQLYLSTGGWSGNESVIRVLQGTCFWTFYWWESLRGGHYYFDFPISKKEKV